MCRLNPGALEGCVTCNTAINTKSCEEVGIKKQDLRQDTPEMIKYNMSHDRGERPLYKGIQSNLNP